MRGAQVVWNVQSGERRGLGPHVYWTGPSSEAALDRIRSGRCRVQYMRRTNVYVVDERQQGNVREGFILIGNLTT